MAGMTKEQVIQAIAKAQVTGGGNNLRDGTGRAALRKFSVEAGFNGARVVFNFVVVSSRKKVGLVSVKTGQKLDIEPNEQGSDFSVVCMMDKHKSAAGNAKAIILALLNRADCSDQDLIDTMTDMDATGAGVGRVIDFDTYRKETRENKIEIVLANWYPVEQTDEQIAAMKQWFANLDAAREAQASAAQAAPTAA